MPDLYVDLDGSLIATDLLDESMLRLVRESPLSLIKLPTWLLQGKAALKDQIAQVVEPDVTTLPYRQEVIAYLNEARDQGRRIVLATASNRRLAERVATHLGLFDSVLASDGQINLSGSNKLDAIRQHAAGRAFSYLGDRPVDLEVWDGANGAVVVSSSNALAGRASASTVLEAHIRPAETSIKRYLHAMRLHQWLKNLLVFVPLMPVLHELTPSIVLKACAAFFAFGLVASGIYVLNDLLDLESDRRHKRKRHRPFASGEISVRVGLLMCAGLCLTSLGLSSAFMPPVFVVVLVLYLGLTTAYSFFLKRRPLVDVFSLAALYTIRLVAGAAAMGLALSLWILSFSLFIFMSLALAKRYVELSGTPAEVRQMSRDRNYHAGDLHFVLAGGVAAGQMATVVLSLYLQDALVVARYSHPKYLWTLVPLILFWIMRIWLKAVRRTLHDDPVIFAARDWVSWSAVGISAVVLWAAG